MLKSPLEGFANRSYLLLILLTVVTGMHRGWIGGVVLAA